MDAAQISRRYGFSAGVLLAKKPVPVCDHGGMLYAIDQGAGRASWRYDAGACVLQPAAYNRGRIYFGSDDGRVHAVDSRAGARLWSRGK
ncbi:MAG: outer membrane protein assembly factor BamB family protein [Planctomycetota bacterium]